MYSAAELRELKIKPKINDITLEILREYYEIFLNPFIYQYKITYANGLDREIELRFDIDNFCHLLGIESIAKRAIRFSEIYKYKGEEGWHNIKNGGIDISHLKQLNLRKFKDVKAKYVYFYLLPTLIESPLGVQFDKNKVDPVTKIECEILFYSTYENAVIHLGLGKKSKETYYIPRTFFVEKLSKDGPKDIYTINQEKINVTRKNRIIMIP